MPADDLLATDPLLPVNAQVAEAWSMLSDGWGAIDWTALPFVSRWLGIDDVEALVAGLMTIKTARRPDDSSAGRASPDATGFDDGMDD